MQILARTTTAQLVPSSLFQNIRRIRRGDVATYRIVFFLDHDNSVESDFLFKDLKPS